MKTKRFGLFFVLFFSHICAFAQNVPVVAVYALRSNDVGENITATVNDLIFSFIKELRNYQAIDMRSEAWPRTCGSPKVSIIFFTVH
ncbi:hypothetical protein K7I13_01315 [Brucepastera parasyntrophica]|uniref:hypothetical protein n=1 Tax=Brucepastera parasyntrophica TaxID=2880008 RepID=UPI00210AA5D3|nr:hypothetical protein [Brucepastera parasyntrophica]ULQ60002.1 hypothetical protein K7I13_01315 [Brucepastera parasyntrophica]